ncbi:MAG TPA: hypothetical protein VNG53_11940 [Bacteroidia bacterium]|nr:hypothetical protein [Bacteroidia bacterium]
MKAKTANDNLNDAILLLQKKQADELLLLKEQFHITYQSLKPLNLIISTFQELTQTPEIKNNILNDLIGLSTGYLTKKILVGTKANSIKNLFGTLLQFAVTNIVSKNSTEIKAHFKKFISNFF